MKKISVFLVSLMLLFSTCVCAAAAQEPAANKQATGSETEGQAIYRLYNAGNNEHLYTTSITEVNVLASDGWVDEGTAWKAPKTGDPVYRLYGTESNEHLYTTDVNEVETLKNNKWTVDNDGKPLFYSGGPKFVYRLYHPGTQRHHLTTDTNEYNSLEAVGWILEGTKMHALSD